MLKTDELSNNLTTISKSLTVTQAWMDTGIKFIYIKPDGAHRTLICDGNTLSLDKRYIGCHYKTDTD